jgi:hypothetical protein
VFENNVQLSHSGSFKELNEHFDRVIKEKQDAILAQEKEEVCRIN